LAKREDTLRMWLLFWGRDRIATFFVFADFLDYLYPPHKTFDDLLRGSGVIILRKFVSDVKTYNDLDPSMANHFRCIVNADCPHLRSRS